MSTKPLQHLAIQCAVTVQSRVVELKRRSERGDVPGWVLITLMTALIVAALLAIARPRLTDMLNKALKDFS
jgi:hypothetical protein